MGSICIILRRPPYGTVDASEAVRHALGGAMEELTVSLILMGSGIHAARKGQNTSNTEYASIESGILDCIDMGVSVYCDRSSMSEELVDAENIIDGVSITGSREIAEVVAGSGTIMIF